MTWCPPATRTSNDGWASVRDVPRTGPRKSYFGLWWCALAGARLDESDNLPGMGRTLLWLHAPEVVQAALRLGEPWLVVHSRLAVDIVVPGMGWCMRPFRARRGRDCLRVGEAMAHAAKELGQQAVGMGAQCH